MTTCDRCGHVFGAKEGCYNTPSGLFCPDCWTGKGKATKALTIKNPHAMRIIKGQKTIEVRSKPTKFRGTIYVHVSKRIERPKSFTYEQRMQCGNVIGTVDIIDCRPFVESDLKAACLPNMLEGHYAWVLANPKIIQPFSLKGQLGLFNVNI